MKASPVSANALIMAEQIKDLSSGYCVCRTTPERLVAQSRPEGRPIRKALTQLDDSAGRTAIQPQPL
jgi:hypothetical protein